MEKPVIRISVRNLVEFILRSGDLDRTRGTSDKEAMQKGSRLHRKIQKQMGSGYRAEVSLKRQTEFEDASIVLEGRADGIFMEDGLTYIDEIKGICTSPARLEEPVPVHLAQAMCYAYIYAEQEGLAQIGIQMTYAGLETEEVRRFQKQMDTEALAVWYADLLQRYHKWISYQLRWREKRSASMKELEFPFVYRPGQKKIVGSVYHSISTGKQIFIQAPTGVGKTMSVIFPAVRAVGEGKGDTIFYLTAKTITRTVAEEAFSILREKGLLFKVLTITAKEKLCFCGEMECTPEHCPYAKGHFDRVNDAVYELWTAQQVYGREQLLEHAQKWQVCPFEMCLDLAVWCDAVICDYNYVFDPNVRLKRFFGEGVKGSYLFLIDEAHNLVDRGRDMFSAALYKEHVLEAKKKVKGILPKLYRALEKVNKELLQRKKECENYQVLENPGGLPLTLLQVQGELDQMFEEPAYEALSQELRDFYFEVRDFLNVSELLDEHYVVYTQQSPQGFLMRLLCVNPAGNLAECLEKGNAAVFFSATLLPMDYHRRLLSSREDDYGIYVTSPFDPKRRKILCAADVSSRYARRGYDEYRKIAEYITKVLWQKKGNYMIFFPSYKMLEEVYNVFDTEFGAPWIRCIRQNMSMDEREREAFLNAFEVQEGTLAAFCIMGGLFSEGIDLMGERLIGAILVGTGLPQICTEREILRGYYEKKGEDGFAYAYRYPGLNKVLQAAGRVIRTSLDTGVILLLDERFRLPEYERILPMEWADREYCSLDTVEQKVQSFWQEQQERRNE